MHLLGEHLKHLLLFFPNIDEGFHLDCSLFIAFIESYYVAYSFKNDFKMAFKAYLLECYLNSCMNLNYQ